MPSKSVMKRRSALNRRKRQNKASKALAIAKQNKKFINKTIENKQVNYAQLPVQISSGGFASAGFFGVLQGAGDGTDSGSTNARVGNSVTLMRTLLKFNFDVASPQATSEQYNKIRLIVVASSDGSQTLGISDILRYNNYTTDGDLVFASPYTTKTTTNKRYDLLMDKVFEVNYGHKASRQITLKKKWGKTGKVIAWNGNSSSAPTDFKVSVICISDSQAANHPVMSFACRHTYKDA